MTYKEANRIMNYAIPIAFVFLIALLTLTFGFMDWLKQNIGLVLLIVVPVFLFGWMFVFFIINKAHSRKRRYAKVVGSGK